MDSGKPLMTEVPVSRIRNFSIIAHIDHGKSTLADRLLMRTGTVSDRDMKAQFLDSMDLERERGITIKLQAARMNYRAKDGQDYILNLIDTPGHVDFSYEVSRSLVACEGALLVVDASQGVEAQTLANVYLALEHDLEIIPVLNKIDLPGAEPERIKQEIEEIIGLDCSDAILASAKEGVGIDEILESIIYLVPPPQDNIEKPLRALIFDSYYDSYRGVIVYFRVMDGTIRKKDKIRLMASGKEYEIDELGVLSPTQVQVDDLHAGEVGYLAASIKAVEDARVGVTPLPWCRLQQKPPCPVTSRLNRWCSAVSSPPCLISLRNCGKPSKSYTSVTLPCNMSQKPPAPWGLGSAVASWGLLHMEIVQERLEREYDLDLITTAPSVIYRVTKIDGDVIEIDNPSTLPDPQAREKIEEPYVRVEMITPEDYVGPLMELCQSRRGDFKDMKYLAQFSHYPGVRIAAGGSG